MQKVLVLGASGMAGHTIATFLKEANYYVIGATRRPISFCKNVIVNLYQRDNLLNLIVEGNFDFVINCVGVLNKNADENKSDAVYLNSFLPHWIAGNIKSQKTRLIHMSTDCVFSGKVGNYFEDSIPDGETFYDRTKALGEVIDNRNLTFRNSIIGPDINPNGIGLMHWFFKQKGCINGFEKALWNGVTTLTLAKAMDCAMQTGLTGLYHLTNGVAINKYELLKLFNQIFRNGNVEVKKIDGWNLNKTLINTRKDFEFQVPSYETMLKEELEWIKDHAELYPAYVDIIRGEYE